MQKRRKRSALIIASVLAILIAVGGSYAMYTGVFVDLSPHDAEYGRVNVEARYINEDIYLEPMPDDFDPIVISGELDNVGDIDAAVKVDLRTSVLIKSDEDGNPLPSDEWYDDITDKTIQLAGVTIDEEKLEANDTRAPFIAIKDLNNPGLYYLLLPSDSNAEGDYTVDISLYVKPDKSMGNKFMDAVLQFREKQWPVSQANDDAILEELGVDLWAGLESGELEILVGDSGEPSMSEPFSITPANTSLYNQLMERVQLMLQGK